MEDNNEKNADSKSGVRNELTKEIKTLVWSEKVTIIDLSNNNIDNLEEIVKFPPNLVELNLSHNQLVDIPQVILNLELLKMFDISFNKLLYFDEVPGFCHHIEDLNLSNNNLAGLPYWVWSESPQKLTKLDLSNNINITKAFDNGYFEEFLQYSTLVTDVKLHNCRLRHHLKLLQTLPRVKVLELGCYDFGRFSSNYVEHLPCPGLDQSYDIEKLNLCNTNLYNIDANIDIYKNLIEIDLSHNNINSLPNEFCNLVNLETCVLSSNRILYLPEDMVKLKKLVCLRIDSNELCMIPEQISELLNLKVLDLYDNSLYEVSDDVWKVEELDLAQNYLEEPADEEYLEKKEKLRLSTVIRLDGR